jgi:hypothetical protein
VASAGWQKNLFFPATTPATEAELQAALSNITNIQIRGNYTDAMTITHLDNVGFHVVPEPSSLITIAIGLAAICFGRRRHR